MEELFEKWRKNGYKKISKATSYNYNATWKYLAPLHKKRVVDLKADDFQYCVDLAEDDDLSFSSIKKIKTLATLLEKYAMRDDIIEKNYASFIVLPKHEEDEKVIFTEAQLKQIENAAQNGIGVAEVILFMCYTGWRISELLLLKPKDYDSVNQVLKGGLKTDAGKGRLVPVPKSVLTAANGRLL